MEPINKTVGKFRVQGTLATPMEITRPKGAALLLPGVMGLTDDVKAEAQNLANQGILVFAIDLYGGKLPANRAEAFKRYRALPSAKTRSLVSAASQWLTKQSGGKPLSLALVGYGLGADQALLCAAQKPAPSILVLYYGGVTTDADLLKTLHCPVLGFFARRDANLVAQRVDAFKSALAKAGVTHQLFSYETDPGFELKRKSPQESAYADTARKRIAKSLESE